MHRIVYLLDVSIKLISCFLSHDFENHLKLDDGP